MGIPVDAVSRMMRYRSTNTTELYYGRTRGQVALQEFNRADEVTRPEALALKSGPR